MFDRLIIKPTFTSDFPHNPPPLLPSPRAPSTILPTPLSPIIPHPTSVTDEIMLTFHYYIPGNIHERKNTRERPIKYYL